jgi:hypothetical protein
MPVFWPQEKALAWGYLYQGSPRVLALVGPKHWIRGHCAPSVAYVINDSVADIFLRFFDYEMTKYSPDTYFNFEAHLQWWVMGKGAEAYIPFRHYGEHGGTPNSEHATVGALTRAGAHRADALAGRLAFLPQYARGSRLRFYLIRAQARALGWARLITLRWIVPTDVYHHNWRDTVRMNILGVQRLL